MNAAVADLVQSSTRHLAPEPEQPLEFVPFRRVRTDDLDHVTPDAVEYVLHLMIPRGHLTLGAAHGGVGKGYFAQMLMVATATQQPLFGVPIVQCNSALFSAEDDKRELRFRHHKVCHAMGISPGAIAERVHLLDASDCDPVLFTELTSGGRSGGITTPTYDALRAYVEANEIGLLIIDNTSDVYDADEIKRKNVRSFLRSLAKVARECNVAVFLLAHVDKNTSRGDGTGTENYSGSTAWHNTPRSRIHFARDKEGNLLIKHEKNNLGPRHAPLQLRWPDGGIPMLDESFGPVVQGIADRGREKALLKLIAKYTARGEFVSTGKSGPSCLTKLFEQEPTMPKYKKASEIFQLLRQSTEAGRLVPTTVKTLQRKQLEVWTVTDAGRQFAEIPAAPIAPIAPITQNGAADATSAEGRANCAHSAQGGVGGARAHNFSPEVSG